MSERIVNEKREKAELGFWLYLMTDLMLFASLFATFMILRHGTNGGPGGNQLFDVGYALTETFILLASSITSGLMLVSAKFKKPGPARLYLAATIGLGVSFLVLELREFAEFASEGNSWQASAFLSAFFTLVGTHGLHILIGLLWALVLYFYTASRGFTSNALRKLGLFTLFWHFLDLVWVFIFSVVYLIGGWS